MPDLSPGTVVTGPFFSNGDRGVGVVQEHTKKYHPLYFVSDPVVYAAVKILDGDRASGGYRRENLTALPTLKEI